MGGKRFWCFPNSSGMDLLRRHETARVADDEDPGFGGEGRDPRFGERGGYLFMGGAQPAAELAAIMIDPGVVGDHPAQDPLGVSGHSAPVREHADGGVQRFVLAHEEAAAQTAS